MPDPDPVVQNPPQNDPAVQNPPAPAAIPGDDPTKDYEARFKGLSRTYQQLQGTSQTTINTLTTEKTTLATQVATLQSTVQAKDGEIATLNGTIKTLTDQLGEEKKTSGTHLKDKTRLKLILKKFSDLAAFEDAGILPEAETEAELETKLTAFRTAAATLAGKKVEERLQGAVPPGGPPAAAPTGDVTETEDFIWEKLMSLSNVPGKEQEWKDWQAKWDKLQAKKSNK